MTPTEWAAVIGAFAAVLAPLTAVLIAVLRLRRENTRQHNENRDAVTARFGELRDDIRDLGHSVDRRIDRLNDSVVDTITRHEDIHHRRRRW